MLTAKKKIAVRQVVPQSSFSDNWAATQMWFEKYKKFLLWGGIAVLALVVVGYIYFSSKAENDRLANSQLRNVLQLYLQQQYKQAITGDPTRGIVGLETIARQYDNTPTGQAAMVYLGNCYLYTGEFDKAIQSFNDASPDGTLLNVASVSGLAAALEGKKDYAGAAEKFEKAASMSDTDFLVAQNHFNAGRAWCLAGNKEKAKECFLKVRDAKTPRFESELARLLAQYDISLD